MIDREQLFARDGHVTMLSLDRYDVGELDGEARSGLESHVETCTRCRERFVAVDAPSLAILPPARHDTGSVRNSMSWVTGGTGSGTSKGSTIMAPGQCATC